MKTCTKCRVSKEPAEFYAYKRSADGLAYECKECVKSRQKNYWYRDGVRSRAKEYKKQYGKRAEVVAKRQTEEIRTAQRAHRIAWLESPRGRAVSLLGACQARSASKGWVCAITLEDILPQIEYGKCSMSGVEFDLSRGRATRCHPWAPSIDRIDCSQGYVKGNVRVICWVLNAALNEFGEDVLNKLVSGLCQRRNGQPSNENHR